ncbi:CPBP family intramembrane glutamic endopeptidase [Parapedobacter sp. DT-150]|uniref:CPBP family intramembrane glutamic endopeptidase n=1 Tax=Parapedobacter sp. DT-150 TaxID=3396162 RepID=UPI003F19E1DA
MTEHNAPSAGIQRYGGNHPIVSLILLLALMLAGAMIFGILAVFIGLAATSSSSDIGNLDNLLSGSGANTAFLKIVQAVSSMGMFILPALLMGVVEKRHDKYLNFKAPVNPMLWFMIIAIMFFSAPIFEQAIKLNEQMRLPEAFSGLEKWMKSKEAELEELTKQLLSDKTYGGLLINLLVVAVIPAIGEEFLFRGCLQQILTRWLRNPHIAIWVTAIVFSAIHLQFYGFLPRLMLGVLFGYLLFWGKNIWLPVLAHFLNNAAATVSAFYLQRQGKSLDEMDFGEQIPNYLYFISFVLTVVLLYQYYKTAMTGNTRRDGKTLG